MSNFLLQNQKGKYRFKIDDNIYLLEPNENQRKELFKIVEDNVVVKDNLEINGTIPMDSIRYIFKELTSIGEEIDNMTDIEIGKAIDNGNRNVELLFREIRKLLEEFLEDIQYNMEQQIKMTSDLIKLMNMIESGEALKNNLDVFNKKYNKNLTEENLESLKNEDDVNIMVDKVKKIK